MNYFTIKWLHFLFGRQFVWQTKLFLMMIQQQSFNWTNVEREVLTNQQIQICEMKKMRKTNEEIVDCFLLNTVTNVYTSIKNTMMGNIWKPSDNLGGRPSYLGDVDTIIFKEKIMNSCFDLKCLNTKDAIQIALELRAERYERAKFIANLCSLNCSICNSYQMIIDQLCPSYPSEAWLTNFCRSNEIYLKCPSSLEETRRLCCNSSSISNFFLSHGPRLLNKDPRLVFNADETSSICSKKFKALTLNKKNLCTVSVSGTEPHISAVLCFNAAGYKLKPFIILPELKNIPNELSLMDAFYVSQSSGWMTSKLFVAFCIFFACNISAYRLTLPRNTQNSTITLIVDNHPSRMNSWAIEFLTRHNIELLTLPAHTSHVMQPFDVYVASPLKTRMASFKFINLVKTIANSLPSKAAQARYLTVSALINSWSSIPREVLIKSFEVTGICPMNPSNPLNNPLTNRVNHPPPPVRRNTLNISSSLLTSIQMRIAIYNKNNGTNINNVFSNLFSNR